MNPPIPQNAPAAPPGGQVFIYASFGFGKTLVESSNGSTR